MQDLTRKAFAGLAWMEVVLAVLLFLPAWSLRFWQAWVYFILLSLCTTVTTLYFLKHAPELVEGRLKAGPTAEQEPSQKVIQAIASALMCVLAVLPGIERRFHPSTIPVAVVVAGDVFVLIGFALMFITFRENSYASSVIRVKGGQRVVSSGPYAVVRHPMYVGGLVLFLATPLALGSVWAIAPALLLCGAIAVRLIYEERYLVLNLEGYDGYRRKVRYRLIPFVW